MGWLRRSWAKKSSRSVLIAWLLVLPVILLRGFTTLYPSIMTIINSFFEINMFKGGTSEFVWLENYRYLLQDPKIRTSIEFTIIFTVISMVFHFLFGLLLALLMNLDYKGKHYLRTIVLIPWAMPMIVIGYAARWAFNDTYGLVNDLIRRIAEGFHMDWLIHPFTARMCVIAVDLWKDVPYFAILALAGLQFIPKELYEAASIDGAGVFKRFWRITLPILKPTLFSLSIFFTLWRITSFDVVYSMTSGGPGEATSLLAYRISIEAFTNLNLGYASAIAVVLFVVMLAVSGVNRLLAKQKD